MTDKITNTVDVADRLNQIGDAIATADMAVLGMAIDSGHRGDPSANGLRMFLMEVRDRIRDLSNEIHPTDEEEGQPNAESH